MTVIKLIWESTWRIILFFMLWAMLLAPPVLIVKDRMPKTGPLPLPLRLYGESTALIATVIAAWVLVRFVDHRPFASLGFSLQRAVPQTLLGSVIGVGMILLTAAILLLGNWSQWQPSGSFVWASLALGGLALLVNTLTQEVVFRGYILQTIQTRGGATVAVLISSVVFGLLHGRSPMTLLNVSLAGILLGYAFIITGNLWLPIGIHFAWNFLQEVFGIGTVLKFSWRLLTMSDGPVLFTGGAAGFESSLAATLATAAGLLVLYLLSHSRTLQP